MKKNYYLMLLALVFLLLNCREESFFEEKADEISLSHSQNNRTNFDEFLKITHIHEDELLHPKNGKNNALSEFNIDTAYILKRTQETDITGFSFLLRKKNETSDNIVYNMFYYKTNSGEWKYFIVKIDHKPNPDKLYGWKKTSLYKLQDEGTASKGCYTTFEFGNVDWFQCSSGHSSNCARNGGECCAGCNHSMVYSYWVNTCDEPAPGSFEGNYGGGGSGNPITMDDIKTALQNNVSPETYQRFLSLSFNLQQGVVDCLYNDYLTNDLVGSVINFLYTHPNTQNPDIIYYRLKAFLDNYSSTQLEWLRNHAQIALLLSEHYKANNNLSFSNWAVDFLMQNPQTSGEQLESWFINGALDFNDAYDVEFAGHLSAVSYDLLIANQNGTLDQLKISWPNWGKLKQDIKKSIARGVHSTAKLVKTKYDEVRNSSYYNVATRAVLNFYIDGLREEVRQITNMNKDTMNWQDLFNIWLFELMPNKYNNKINFTDNSNVINGSNLYNPTTNAVYKFPKGDPDIIPILKQKLANGTMIVGSEYNAGYFHYKFDQYFATLSNNNIGIQMLGSYPIYSKVLLINGNVAKILFRIENPLNWKSATRFVQNGDKTIGIIDDDKEIGEELHLGGNMINTYTWTEYITF